MTQQELGSSVGIKFQQIQKYESGANRISASRLWDIAGALDVPVSYFFEGLARDRDPAEDPAQTHSNGVANGHANGTSHANGANGTANGHALNADVLDARETSDLIRAYYHIPDSQRRKFLELAKAMGDAG